MKRGIQLASIAGVLLIVMSGCHGIGTVSETYVNEKDAKQSLELTGRGSVKLLIAGSVPAPQGRYTLWNNEKATSGSYSRIEDAYILNISGGAERKLKIQPDSSLRDENGILWQVKTRSHTLRAGTAP